MANSETIGQRIKNLLDAAGYSQQYVADKVGVSRVAVTKWESGQTANLKLENLMQLCGLFGISVEYLIYGKQSEDINNAESTQTRLVAKKNKKIRNIEDNLPFLDEDELDATKSVVDTFKNRKATTSKTRNNK